MDNNEQITQNYEQMLAEATHEEREKMAKWYIIHTYSAHEQRVHDDILKMVENSAAAYELSLREGGNKGDKAVDTHENLQEYIFDVVVPEEEDIVERNGKRKVITRKKYPAYCFIKMIYTDHVYYKVTSLHAVTGFVGAGGKPEPLTQDEIRRMGLEKLTAQDLGICVGDMVKIIDGAFESYFAEVKKINEEAGVVEVEVLLFGKPTPLKLEFKQVQKA